MTFRWGDSDGTFLCTVKSSKCSGLRFRFQKLCWDFDHYITGIYFIDRQNSANPILKLFVGMTSHRKTTLWPFPKKKLLYKHIPLYSNIKYIWLFIDNKWLWKLAYMIWLRKTLVWRLLEWKTTVKLKVSNCSKVITKKQNQSFGNILVWRPFLIDVSI